MSASSDACACSESPVSVGARLVHVDSSAAAVSSDNAVVATVVETFSVVDAAEAVDDTAVGNDVGSVAVP